MDRLGLLDVELPEVCAGRGVTQPVEHYYDVFGHALATVDVLDGLLCGAPPEGGLRPVWEALQEAFAFADLRAYLDEEPVPGRSRKALLKLAGLLHDVAKPDARASDESGRIRFFGHAELGARVAQRIMRRLRFSHRETAWVVTLVEEHLRPLQLASPGETPTRRALARFFRDTGDAATGLLLLSLADHLAARGPMASEAAWRAHIAYLAWVLRARFEDERLVRPPRLVSGHDVMAALGIGPGPEVGRVLRAVEEAQEAGDVTTREEALTLIRRLAAGGGDQR
jgi:putative nucleotidyltransferase with HDIG domain